MKLLTAFSILAVVAIGVGWILLVPVIAAVRDAIDARRDRRRIMAEGTNAPGTVVRFRAGRHSGYQYVDVEFAPSAGAKVVTLSETASDAAIARAGLIIGSSVEIRFRPAAPRRGFIAQLAPPLRRRPGAPGDPSASEPRAYYVSYVIQNPPAPTGAPLWRAPVWYGAGELTVLGTAITLTGKQRRMFRLPTTFEKQIPLECIADVEAIGDVLRFVVSEPGSRIRPLMLRTVDAAEAAEIAAQLPVTRTAAFSPALAEATEFEQRLAEVTPLVPVNTALVAVNVVVFLLVAMAGGGFLTAQPEVMARLGSDFTPLTLGGQWWRLLSSAFMHFGLAHLAFNMWALLSSGPLAERLYGSSRYLTIYLAAALVGSAVSLWWHPIVNGAGASGAIFGVFGAILAYFVRGRRGVPASVVERHRNSVLAFIGYNLMYSLGRRSIDNAAHVGGLVTGFVLGYLLARPLDREQAPIARELKLTVAIAVIALGAVAVSAAWGPSLETLLDGRSLAELARAPARKPAVPASEPAPVVSRPTTPSATPTLAPTPQIFWGLTLGETRAEVLRNKGPAAAELGRRAIYRVSAADSSGQIEVRYRAGPQPEVDRVTAVYYVGARQAAPAELPYVIGLSGAEMSASFQLPVSSRVPNSDAEYETFRNGMTAYLWHWKVQRYGIEESQANP
ncbi:MAG: rhomboid family intramembrane serine protease [Proteobacteria bacterium]|nr:rhomboid family intramembrane serine protease [Pseudomonadota bacterium]